MNYLPRAWWPLVCLAALLGGPATVRAAGDDPLAWSELTNTNRPWCCWWWPGSAVDPANLTRSLERCQAAGLGGVQIIPVSGATNASAADIDYLSPRWMNMLRYTVTEAKRLNLGVDMSTGTGRGFGGPNVSDTDADAKVVVTTNDVAPDHPLTATYDRKQTQALVGYPATGPAENITDRLRSDGSVDWTADNRAWRVYGISQTPSGRKVTDAAPGGAGGRLNLIYPDAVTRWLQRYTDALAGDDGPKPRAQFQEAGDDSADWSPEFFTQFLKLRGYPLQFELPALFDAGTNEVSVRVRADYRSTVSEILTTEALPRWAVWARQHGFLAREKAHGSPGNLLDLYAGADIPETEMSPADRPQLAAKFASSAAHVAGHRLTSGATGAGRAQPFTETLADVKYLADDLFLAGVNHIFYRGNCYSPDEAAWPGWQFHDALEMNPRNSIWHDVPAVNNYIARCQSLLQSGQPDNDVLLYWPVADFWMQPGGPLLPHFTLTEQDWLDRQPVGAAARQLWNLGYGFDYVSDQQLAKSQVVRGRIQLSGGTYRAIVVPACRYMPVVTMQNLALLAGAGATVIFEKQLPAEAPGLADLTANRAALKGMAEALAGLVKVGELPALLAEANLARESLTDAGLSFVRRADNGGWNYFIANRGTGDFAGWVTPGRTADAAVLMDPMSGRTGVAAFHNGKTGPQVYLDLPAGGSVILRLVTDRAVTGPAWDYWRPAGAPTPLTGDWQVSFVQGGPERPANFTTRRPGSWTQLGDTNAQRWAGSALYSISFNAPAGTNAAALDLGDVRQSARVRVNGRDYGTLVIPPFRVVVDHLKPAGNRLEVEITNVTANRIRDLDRRGEAWDVLGGSDLVNRGAPPFNAANRPLTDSGLLGPVTLTPVVAGVK